MKKIITFSGLSERFTSQGYPIKPLIEIGSKKVYDLAIKNLTSNYEDEKGKDFIFILKESDCINYSFDELISNDYPQAKVKIIKDHREGPVKSVLDIQLDIPDTEEIVVGYCDLYINWNFDEFINFCHESNSDGVVASHNNWHPHRVYNNYFCYLQTQGSKVLQLREKEHFTDNPLNEPASSGIYYFKTGKMLKYYLNELVERDIRVKNEFYITLPYNIMIEDKLNVHHYDHKNYLCLGTPKDIECIKSFITLKNNFSDNISKAIEYMDLYYEKI